MGYSLQGFKRVGHDLAIKTTTTAMYFVDFEHLLSKTLSRSEFTLAIKDLRNNLTRSEVHSWQRTSNLFMASRMDTIYEQ